jgi:phosphate uptake regulator
VILDNMKRKVIKQANQAYTITLPIDLVRKNNINKNKELEVIEDGKSLTITNTSGVEIKKAKIELEDLNERNIYRHIAALYANGTDEIEIKSSKDITPAILQGLTNTIGYALLCKKDNIFQIKDIGGTNYSDLDEIFKRVFQMILSFYESAINDIFGEQKETETELRGRDREINKFCLFLQRSINKMSYPDPIKGRILFTYSFELEKIGDEIQRLWRVNIKYKVKKTPEIKKLIEKSLEGLGKAFEVYYQFNNKKSEELYNLRDKLREDSLKIKITDKHTLRFVRHIIRIIEDAADLSHLTLMIRL